MKGLKISIILNIVFAVIIVLSIAFIIRMALSQGIPNDDYSNMKLFSSVDEVDEFVQSQGYEILGEIEFSETIKVDGYYGKTILMRGKQVKIKAYTFIDAENAKAFCEKYAGLRSGGRQYGLTYASTQSFFSEKASVRWYDVESLIFIEASNIENANELYYRMQMVFSRNMITG